MKKAQFFAAVEFLIPLLSMLVFLRASTDNLGSEVAGYLILLNTVALFCANLELTGGRALSGFVGRNHVDNNIYAFLFCGLKISICSSVLISGAVFYFAWGAFKDSFELFLQYKFSIYIFCLTGVLGQVNNYIGWCRLGFSDNVKRSQIIFVCNLVSLVFSVVLLSFSETEFYYYCMPMLLREVLGLVLNVKWVVVLLGVKEGRANDLFHLYKWVSLKSFFISVSVAFFEPLFKYLVGVFVGLDYLPTFELVLRIFSSVRNAVVVYLQSFSDRLIREDGSVFAQLVTWRLFVACSIVFVFILSGVKLIGPYVFPVNVENLLGMLILTVPGAIFYVSSQALYLRMMFSGSVSLLLLKHVLMIVGPLSLIVFSNFLADLNLTVLGLILSYSVSAFFVYFRLLKFKHVVAMFGFFVVLNFIVISFFG